MRWVVECARVSACWWAGRMGVRARGRGCHEDSQGDRPRKGAGKKTVLQACDLQRKKQPQRSQKDP